MMYSNFLSLLGFALGLLFLLSVLIILTIGYPIFSVLLVSFIAWVYFKIAVVFSVTTSELRVLTGSGIKTIPFTDVESLYYYAGPIFGDYRTVTFKFDVKNKKTSEASFKYISSYHVCELLNFLHGNVKIKAKSFQRLGIIEKDGKYLIS